MQVLGRSFPLPPFIRPAFALRSRCGTNSRMGLLTLHQTVRQHRDAVLPGSSVDKGPSQRSSGDATERPGARTDRAEANADEETTEEEGTSVGIRLSTIR